MPISYDGKLYEDEFALETGKPLEARTEGQTSKATPVPSSENNASVTSVEPPRAYPEGTVGEDGLIRPKPDYMDPPARETPFPRPRMTGIVSGLIDSAKKAFTLPGDVLAGKVAPDSPEAIERAFDLAGWMVGAPAPVAGKLADGTLGSFAGVKSKSLPKDKLYEANNMLLDKVSPDEIYQKTGFFKGSDNRWRYELDDSKAKLKDIDWEAGKTYKMEDVLDHPELYKAYPEIKEMPFKVADKDSDYIASFTKSGGIEINPRMTPGTDDHLLDILTHELQHKIQTTEGFNIGSNPAREFKKAAEAIMEKARENGGGINGERNKELLQLYIEMQNSRKDFGNYMYTRVPGEIEANQAMARRQMTPEQRQMFSPEETKQILEGQRQGLSGVRYRQEFNYPE